MNFNLCDINERLQVKTKIQDKRNRNYFQVSLRTQKPADASVLVNLPSKSWRLFKRSKMFENEDEDKGDWL